MAIQNQNCRTRGDLTLLGSGSVDMLSRQLNYVIAATYATTEELLEVVFSVDLCIINVTG
jgi:hypothetical protein